ncbi:MAG: biopolymer transporter ExbD [Burkholderiaceae bacterium]
MAASRLRLRQVTRKRESDDRLIPLINVVFLMLIFFLLAGSIRPPDPFDVTLPQSNSEQARPRDAMVLLVGPDGRLSVDGAVLEEGRPDALSQALAAHWRGTDPTDNPQLRKIEIRADQQLPIARLRLILSAVSGAGADEVSLITQR